jgi:hypothetical protein
MNCIETMSIKRRTVVIAAGVFWAACGWTSATAADRQHPEDAGPIPMIHVSDLFRPHDDPDDHWDLACVYALAAQRLVDLRAIMIDYPKPQRKNDPDVMAVAQLNQLTGLSVPVIVGSPHWLESPATASPEHRKGLRGVRAMLEIMRWSPRPVVINILGSCRDVALAGRLEPELFTTKCRAVYVNAGSGTPDASKATRLEWNVHLDPQAYCAIFDLPCPIYWMPCFEEVRRDPDELFRVAEYGTFYRFRQGDVLPHLSTGLRNYFAFMFQHGRMIAGTLEDQPLRPDWLQSLVTAPDATLMDRINRMDRNMWCTGGFFHAVGLTVARDGTTVPLQDAVDAVYTFDPVNVRCSPDAVTRWSKATGDTGRFMFHVRDEDRYSQAMTTALRALLCTLR